MGCLGDGVRYILLPNGEKSEQQMGSSVRRQQAKVCYRIMLLGGILAFLLMAVAWYGVLRTSKTSKQQLHDAMQDQLSNEASEQWHDNWNENKDADWDWDSNSQEYPVDYSGDYNDYDYDEDDEFNKSQSQGKSGALDDDDDDEDYHDNYWYRDDYMQHVKQAEDSEPYSMEGGWDADIRDLVQGDATLAFMDNYKNPCWSESIDIDNPYTNNYYLKEKPNLKSYFDGLFAKIGLRHWRMRCLPYFYVFDGPEAEFQTKDNFFHAFSSHPYIAKPPVHRPQFWNKRFLENNTSIRDYLDLFDQAASEIRASNLKMTNGPVKLAHPKILGDDSGSYFYSFDQWKQLPANTDLDPSVIEAMSDEPTYTSADLIVSQTPDVKIIIMLRNPLKRLAEYYYRVLNPGADMQKFHDDVLQSTSILNQCLQSRSPRSCLYDGELTRKMKVPLRIALYSVFIADWMTRIEEENIKIVIYEEFRRFPVKTLNSVYKFLGLGHIAPEQFGSLKKQWYQSAQDNKTYIWPMLNETRTLLKAFFAPYNENLQLLTDRADLVTMWDTATDPDELRHLQRSVVKPNLKRKPKKKLANAQKAVGPEKSRLDSENYQRQTQQNYRASATSNVAEQKPYHEPAPVPAENYRASTPADNQNYRAPAPADNQNYRAPAPADNQNYRAPAQVEKQNYQAPAQVEKQNYQAPAQVGKQNYQAPAQVGKQNYQAPAQVENQNYQAPAPADNHNYQAPAPADNQNYQAPAPADKKQNYRAPAPANNQNYQVPAPAENQNKQAPALEPIPADNQNNQVRAPVESEYNQGPEPAPVPVDNQNWAPSAAAVPADHQNYQAPASKAVEQKTYQALDPAEVAPQTYQAPALAAAQVDRSYVPPQAPRTGS